MDSQNLYNKLKQAYTESNLNTITSHIIELYRHNNAENILKLGKLIKDYIAYDIKKVNRLFNHMMMLYHPDKLNYYTTMIEKYRNKEDLDKLSQFSHIFIVQEALKSKPVNNSFDYDELFSSQVKYGLDEDDFDSINGIDPAGAAFEIESDFYTDDTLVDFIMAIQKKENIDFNINSLDFYLEQLQGELDLSHSNIFELNGIEHCINITSIDLSHNQIIDIAPIKELVYLQSIYLSFNNISDIDALSKMDNLKYLDLSFNDITNIETLSDLSNLEYLNVIGNDIPLQQLEKFRKNNVVLIY